MKDSLVEKSEKKVPIDALSGNRMMSPRMEKDASVRNPMFVEASPYFHISGIGQGIGFTGLIAGAALCLL